MSARSFALVRRGEAQRSQSTSGQSRRPLLRRAPESCAAPKQTAAGARADLCTGRRRRRHQGRQRRHRMIVLSVIRLGALHHGLQDTASTSLPHRCQGPSRSSWFGEPTTRGATTFATIGSRSAEAHPLDSSAARTTRHERRFVSAVRSGHLDTPALRATRCERGILVICMRRSAPGVPRSLLASGFRLRGIRR